MRYELKELLNTLQTTTQQGSIVDLRDLLDNPLTAEIWQLKQAIQSEIKGIDATECWGYFMDNPEGPGVRVTAEKDDYKGTIYNIYELLAIIDETEARHAGDHRGDEIKALMDYIETGKEPDYKPKPAKIRLKTIYGTHITAKCGLLKQAILETLEETPEADTIFFDKTTAHCVRFSK